MPCPRPVLALALAGLIAGATLTLAQPQPRPDDAARPGAAAPGERRPDVMGRVATVSPDGKRLTINAPPARPQNDGQPPARPEPTTVNLSDKTQLNFFGVGDNEAKPAPGLMAMIWLEDGSRDQAARVRFMRREGEERPDVQGRVVGVSPDGRTVTVETRDPDSGRPGAKVDLHIANYTQSLYYGVDRDGAKPTADYLVLAWLEKGSRDTPVRVRYAKNDGRDFGGGPGGPPPPVTPPPPPRDQ